MTHLTISSLYDELQFYTHVYLLVTLMSVNHESCPGQHRGILPPGAHRGPALACPPVHLGHFQAYPGLRASLSPLEGKEGGESESRSFHLFPVGTRFEG